MIADFMDREHLCRNSRKLLDKNFKSSIVFWTKKKKMNFKNKQKKKIRCPLLYYWWLTQQFYGNQIVLNRCFFHFLFQFLSFSLFFLF